MKKEKYIIKNEWVCVGKFSAKIELIPDIINTKFITCILSVKARDIEFEGGFVAPDGMELKEALKKIMVLMKKRARHLLKFLQLELVNPFTGEELQNG